MLGVVAHGAPLGSYTYDIANLKQPVTLDCIPTGMLGQGPHRFIWPDTVEVCMHAASALHNMLTTNQWPPMHITLMYVSVCCNVCSYKKQFVQLTLLLSGWPVRFQ